ncbi:uncharacterized protein J3D65DRAFT_20303 [Phyllosticta citribraziliensis]|uniref:Uncharacterized protein n=1 Tax=Phyllosticta citribraziliensis TaxID=989973 RepID=A0ABR1MB23_9PEZI
MRRPDFLFLSMVADARTDEVRSPTVNPALTPQKERHVFSDHVVVAPYVTLGWLPSILSHATSVRRPASPCDETVPAAAAARQTTASTRVHAPPVPASPLVLVRHRRATPTTRSALSQTGSGHVSSPTYRTVPFPAASPRVAEGLASRWWDAGPNPGFHSKCCFRVACASQIHTCPLPISMPGSVYLKEASTAACMTAYPSPLSPTQSRCPSIHH